MREFGIPDAIAATPTILARKRVLVNCIGASSSSSSGGAGPPGYDENRTTNWTWTADDQIAAITAVNVRTGNQTTAFGYGTTLGTSDVARNDVLSSVTYADGGAVSYLVNRQSEVKQLSDQNGTVHAYTLDLLGRRIEDAITTLGTGIDATVQRIGTTYEVRGNIENVTSFSSPTVGQGTVVNDVQRVYNSFEQLTAEYQEHNGAVNLSTSVNVQYQYANGSANTVRPTAIVYPNGRVLNLSYETSSGMDDALSRIASLIDNDGSTHLADYTRLGLATIVQVNSPQPQIAWSLVNGTGADPYTGLDQFNRVVDNRWYSAATSADLDRILHGYDLASNRVWRKNTVAAAAGVYLDEFYEYDGLYRLAYLQRGQLNSTNTGIVPGTQTFTQQWVLDPTGNWAEFVQQDSSGTLNQLRAANTMNEITEVSPPWVTPAYDAAGNMTAMPQPANTSVADDGVYDAWNRLMSVASGGATLVANVYDGVNRRTSKAVSGTMRDYYYSSSWQALEERVGGSGAADRQFVWGLRYIDDIVLRDRGTERLYALQDDMLNVTSACNASGSVQERYAYAGYAWPMFLSSGFAQLSGSQLDWEVLYAAYRWDAETGLYDVRQRYLHPLLGTWLTQDLAGPEASDVNLYAYVTNRPLVYIDPTGEIFWIPIIIIAAAVVLLSPSTIGPEPPPPPPPPPDPRRTMTAQQWGGIGTGRASRGNCWRYATCSPTQSPGPPDPEHFAFPPGLTLPLNCRNLMESAMNAGAIAVDADADCPPCYYKIYGVIAPPRQGVNPIGDMHWYRQEANGSWTHKGGAKAVETLDASGFPITNPVTADRDYTSQPPGLNYSVDCGYLCWPYDKRLS